VDFAATVTALQARHFDSVLFTNNFTYRDEPLLGVADELGFRVVFGPHAELNVALWQAGAPATADHARRIIYPLVDHLKQHPSLLGYNVVDDAPDRLAPKIALAVQAFKERDPERPAAPVLIEGQDEVARAARTDVRLTYVYPSLVVKAPCDFSLPADQATPSTPGATATPADPRNPAGPPTRDVISERLRHVAALAGDGAPLWVILQTHGGTRAVDPSFPDGTALREPTREEVRLQHWLAVGEGAKGIFWFTYSTQQFWTGLRDNEALLSEVTDLARRMLPLRPLLSGLKKAPDQAVVTAGAALPPPFRPYASTLVDGEGKVYVVAANRSCSPQVLAVDVPGARGWLRDVETEVRYLPGAPLTFRGGDGRLFELLPE
jgi:hypothetical protein